ncbi:MAG: NAD(P)-dependent oxidoreductase [Chloroflexi bacterium]|nr:NAD(P)-dependent oxidoreductase [Chloroflexota bacterium]MBV9598739.1 NAD(P)-dependent oxidoreductase [Chloroflexota bacterium]
MSVAYPGPVLVLGHSGFIGKPLTQLLSQRAADVHGFSSRDVNLRDATALTRFDPFMGAETTVFVCAALTPDRGATIDACVDHINMSGNLARYLSRQTARKVVFVSSDAVYPMVEAAVDEDTPTSPAGAYPVAKYASERLMEMGTAAQSVPLLIVRPTGVFGPGDTHNSYGPNRFIRTALADHSVRLFGQGEESRDHLYLDDLTRILSDLGVSEATGVLNIATGTSRTFGSIVELLQTLTPEPFEVVNAPRAGAITHRRFDIRRLSATLPGLHFTPFEDALKATLSAAVDPGRA